jgi:hypothetical protein
MARVTRVESSSDEVETEYTIVVSRYAGGESPDVNDLPADIQDALGGWLKGKSEPGEPRLEAKTKGGQPRCQAEYWYTQGQCVGRANHASEFHSDADGNSWR